MQFFPSEIESVEDFGELDGSPVKMIKTVGGFYAAVGKKNKKDVVLGGGSHAAIVRYNIQKAHPSFRASLMKSEFYNQFQVKDLTKELPKNFINQGFELYSVSEPNGVFVSITKHQNEIGRIGLLNKGESFKIEMNTKKCPIELSRVLTKVVADIGIENKKDLVL